MPSQGGYTCRHPYGVPIKGEIMNNLEGILAWLAGDDSKISPEDLKEYQAIVFSPEADEIHSIAATELGATA